MFALGAEEMYSSHSHHLSKRHINKHLEHDRPLQPIGNLSFTIMQMFFQGCPSLCDTQRRLVIVSHSTHIYSLQYIIITPSPYIYIFQIYRALLYRHFNQISAFMFCLPDIIIIACDWKLCASEIILWVHLGWHTETGGYCAVEARKEHLFGSKIMPYSLGGCHFAKPNPKLIELCCIYVYSI